VVAMAGRNCVAGYLNVDVTIEGLSRGGKLNDVTSVTTTGGRSIPFEGCKILFNHTLF